MLVMISIAAVAGMLGLLLGVITGTKANAARHRIDLEAAAPPTPSTPVATDLCVQSSPAVGRARVYYTTHPDVDVLEAVLDGLRRL
ncbi:hypothetical protein [Salinispora mooreana]|uniref:hypothetical protein n=1 Tax=Salinispora mooreana TaxID=999545 RepID=UPI0003776CBB|nr:hypothetical protein [Salinispora mooreana]